MHRSVLHYAKGRWLKVTLLVCIAAIVAYCMDDSVAIPNGGTTLGISLGIISAVLMLWLMWLGIRKRRYRATLGSVQGWVSAHIYLGSSLLLLATLHSGFQFDVNIHSFSWLLMSLVIFSGVWGVTMYLRYPSQLNRNRAAQSRELMFDQLEELDKQIVSATANFPSDIVTIIDSSLSGTQLGGSARQQLSKLDFSRYKTPDSSSWKSNAQQRPVIDWLTTELARCRDKKRSDALKESLEAITSRQKILAKLREDIRIKAMLSIWLYFHVPLAFGSIAAVCTHIISVMVYR